MANNANARSGDAGNGGTGWACAVSEHDTTNPAEPSIRQIDIDPVRTWRAVARHMPDHDLRHWRARADSVLAFAAFESPYPEHDRLIVGWQIEAVEAELTARERRQNLPAGTAAGFSDAFVQDLKERIDLAELVQDWGDPLQKRGSEHVGDCPFHDSKSGTSLNINADKGLWLCRGCGRGGDAITWLTERWGLNFTEAVTTLATMAGIEIPEQPTLKRTPKRRAVRNA